MHFVTGLLKISWKGLEMCQLIWVRWKTLYMTLCSLTHIRKSLCIFSKYNALYKTSHECIYLYFSFAIQDPLIFLRFNSLWTSDTIMAEKHERKQPEQPEQSWEEIFFIKESFMKCWWQTKQSKQRFTVKKQNTNIAYITKLKSIFLNLKKKP